MPFGPETALLLVDVQRDFCHGGALAVPDGDSVVPVCNTAAARAAIAGSPIVASRDWHHPDSPHFAENGGAWPVHCVQGTAGARLHPDLLVPGGTLIVTKGDRERDPDGFDAFDGHLSDGRSLDAALRSLHVEHVVVMGLATDYCVKNSALGARRAGFAVTVLTDGIRAVNLAPDDGRRALETLSEAGVALQTLDEFHPA